MNVIKGLLVLALFSACSASHTLRFEHSVAHAIQLADKVLQEDLQDSTPVPPVSPQKA